MDQAYYISQQSQRDLQEEKQVAVHSFNPQQFKTLVRNINDEKYQQTSFQREDSELQSIPEPEKSIPLMYTQDFTYLRFDTFNSERSQKSILKKIESEQGNDIQDVNKFTKNKFENLISQKDEYVRNAIPKPVKSVPMVSYQFSTNSRFDTFNSDDGKKFGSNNLFNDEGMDKFEVVVLNKSSSQSQPLVFETVTKDRAKFLDELQKFCIKSNSNGQNYTNQNIQFQNQKGGFQNCMILQQGCDQDGDSQRRQRVQCDSQNQQTKQKFEDFRDVLNIIDQDTNRKQKLKMDLRQKSNGSNCKQQWSNNYKSKQNIKQSMNKSPSLTNKQIKSCQNKSFTKLSDCKTSQIFWSKNNEQNQVKVYSKQKDRSSQQSFSSVKPSDKKYRFDSVFFGNSNSILDEQNYMH